MLKNDALVAKFGVDTAENERRKECCVEATAAVGAGSGADSAADISCRDLSNAIC